MPAVDMPLEELKKYNGTNPRPADFDDYWEKALNEMRAVDSQVELVPSNFELPFAKCFDLYFTGVKGARIHAKYVRPNCVDQPKPAVLIFHGYSSNAGDWSNLIGYAACGVCVAALDCRGQGGISQDPGGTKGTTLRGHVIRGLNDPDPSQLMFRDVYLDTVQLADIVMNFDEVDSEQVSATGGSQGGGLTVACAALQPRIKKAAPVFPFLSDYKRVWDMDLGGGALEELGTFFRYFDPRHEREQEIFTKLGYIDIQNLAGRIKAEVLWGLGLRDTICPPSSQFAAYNKITAKKEMLIYPDFGHEKLADHGDYILQFLIGA